MLIILCFFANRSLALDNQEKVEKDEAAHAAQQKEIEAKTSKAEGESRLALLRKRARILRGDLPEDDHEEAEALKDEQNEEHVGSMDVPAAKRQHFDLVGDADGFEDMLLGSNPIKSDSRRIKQSANSDANGANKKSANGAGSEIKVKDDEKFGFLEKSSPWYAGGTEKPLSVRKQKEDLRSKERNDPTRMISVAIRTKKELETLKSKKQTIDSAFVAMGQDRRRVPRNDTQVSEVLVEKKDRKTTKKKKKEPKSFDEMRQERLKREEKEAKRSRELLEQDRPTRNPHDNTRGRTPQRYQNRLGGWGK